MAYDTPWDWHDPLGAVAQAYKRAGNFADPSPDVLYRFDAVSYASSDEWGDWYSTGPRLELTCYHVKKWTPTGATLWMMSGARHRHCNFSHTKQFACRTPQQALVSFRERRKSQIRRLEAQARRAKIEHDLAYPLDIFIRLP